MAARTNRKRSAVTIRRMTDRPIKTLERVLSKAGIASRTEARSMVANGRVRVNGKLTRDSDQWIDLELDRVTVDGKPLQRESYRYVLFYKPKGCLTTRRDPEGRKTIYDLLPDDQQKLITVGRLDLETSGLLILTNDNQFSETLTNPISKVPKTYLVKASIHIPDEDLQKFRDGIELKDGPTLPAYVERIRESGGKSVFEITIVEGRNRQVRRMVEALGGIVLKLVRVKIGDVRIGDLPIGSWRDLTPEEVRALQRKR